MHWCGGKVTYFGVNSEEVSKCSCGAKMPAGCCNDVQVNVKLSNCDYLTSVTKIIYPNIWIANTFSIFDASEFDHNYPLILRCYSSYHAPPVLKGPVFLLYCTLLV